VCSSRRRHTRSKRDWSSDVCSSDLSGARHSRAATFRAAYQEDFGPDLARYPTRTLEEDSATVIDMYQSDAYRRRHEITAEAKARSEERRVGRERKRGRRACREERER